MMINLILIFLSLFSTLNTLRTNENDQVLDLIRSAGYRGEAHKIATEDGYILKLHRIIPRNPNGRQPILIMHGILATAADFVVTGRNVALAYLLSDHGYDVWMGNSRGSKHSSTHRYYAKNTAEYWTFSWHEMGYYDLASMIDYILSQTGALKIYYAAHSQGTTNLLVLLSSKPHYNEKIIQAHLMAPPPFRKKLPKSLFVRYMLRYLDTHEKYKFVDLRRWYILGEIIGSTICRNNELFVFRICKRLLTRGFGGNPDKDIEVDLNILPTLVRYASPHASVMQFTHYYQNMIADKFQRFDYKENNIKIYNSSVPPEYELYNVMAPIYLYHAEFDNFITEKGVSHLKSRLPNVRRYRIISNWNHIDFVYSKKARDILYKDILRSLEYE